MAVDLTALFLLFVAEANKLSAVDKKEVFISYNGKNFDLAQYLCNMLEGAGVSCWIAPRDIEPAKQWAESIVEGLNNCNVMALLVSSTSLASQEVAKEVNLANTAKKDILPIRVEDVILSGPLEYHLSTRQWLDAIKGEKIERFQSAVTAILGLLKKSADSSVSDSSVMSQARALVARLNQKHAKQLDATNAMFSARGSEGNKVSIFYPQRIGATGVDLIAEFDCKEKSVRIYANAASNGDKLKTPFCKLIEDKHKNILPKLDGNDKTKQIWIWGGNRYEFVTLMPKTPISTTLLNETAEIAFPRFASHVEALSSSVITDLLNWTAYAKDISDAFDRMEIELKKVFPENEGWRVGAPEGARINGFRSDGKINVFKKSWMPKKDNYKEHGLLSITLKAGNNFLKDMKIGVLKYENWFDLGDFSQRILEQGSTGHGDSVTSSEWFPLEFRLPDEWQDSGLSSSEAKWQGKLDWFVNYMVECFKKLKKLEPLLDEACAALPALQDKDPASIPDAGKKEWGSSALYIRNRLRLLAERVKARSPSDKITVDLRFRITDWPPSQLLLAVKVGNFDAAIAFHFRVLQIDTVVTSLEPPDFEAAIVMAFFQKHHPALTFASVPKSNTVCHGKSISEWIDQFEAMVEEQIDAYLAAMSSLADHLEQCRQLSEFVAGTLTASLPEADGWVINNNAADSLETGNGISIHRSSWLAPSHNQGDSAPLLVQIVPNKACFDALWLEVSFMGQQVPALDRIIGRIIGASDFAFREMVTADGTAPAKGIWGRPLKGRFQKTGGSQFDVALPDETERADLAGEIQMLANTVKVMEPLFAEACKTHNELQFKADYESLVDKLTETIGKHFPGKDGWVVKNMVKTFNKHEHIAVFKSSWCEKGSPLGQVAIAVGSNSDYFEDVYYSVIKLSPGKDFPSEAPDELAKALDPLKSGKAQGQLLWWKYGGANARFSGGGKKALVSGPAREEFLNYYSEIFKELKEKATPVIDKLLKIDDVTKLEKPGKTGKPEIWTADTIETAVVVAAS